MTDAIDFYFDFSSPYGYFARHGVDALAARTGRDIVWKPIMIGSAFKASGNQPLMSQPLKGPYSVHDWERMGRLYNIPWQLPDPFPIAALAPARAFYWIEATRDTEVARNYAMAVFDTYFGKGIDISSREVAADLGQLHGIPRAQLLKAIDDPIWKGRLKEETDKAIARGVFGSPFFIVDGEAFWGFDRIPMLEEWIRRGGW
ncbi:MAG: 2-hydroxychromene-2-carboxylate isomerase [Alphaproteobacteria bacterium]|nr:2-hydroxychromene-2-carboxylate isomerase [Alphaproteobacteria bacterium]